MNDGKIQFKPLTDGLGFHPFSDGLPYSPAPKPSPTLPSFARTLPKATPALPASFVQPPAAQSVQKTRTQPVEFPSEAGIFMLFKRALAYALDSIFNSSLCAVTLSLSLVDQGVSLDALYDWETWLTVIAFLAFFNWALIVGQEVAFRSTLFKRLLGLRVEGSALAILAHGILFIPSAFFCGIGLIWALGDPRRQCWHDLAAGVRISQER